MDRVDRVTCLRSQELFFSAAKYILFTNCEYLIWTVSTSEFKMN